MMMHQADAMGRLFRRGGQASHAPLLRRVATDIRGGMAMLFSLALIPLLGCIALAVDVSTWHSARTELQKIADGAAIVSARELRIGAAATEVLEEAARLYAKAVIDGGTSFVENPEITAEISQERDSVTITVASTVSPIFSRLFNTGLSSVHVSATARLAGREPICMISTDMGTSHAMALSDYARLDAEDCGIYVNSGSSGALSLDGAVNMQASLICVNGGVSYNGGSISPVPVTGCPRIGDPLSHKAMAIASPLSCDEDDDDPKKVNGNKSLNPGSYCGGIEIGSSAHITFGPGTYHIGGDGLKVTGGARITASNVTFVFHDGAGAYFSPESSLNLSASKKGTLAGILFIESSSGGDATFRISSNDARRLLGTIYLPKSMLLVDADKPVAGDSAYTVVVAREIEIANRSRLVLNTDYAATDVPVPDGVGPSSDIMLSQ